jgi:hypothetical protein
MLRAAVLLSFLRRILRFSTTGHPGALGACYVASWQLPRLDSHQLADDSLQGTPSSVSPPSSTFLEPLSSIVILYPSSELLVLSRHLDQVC